MGDPVRIRQILMNLLGNAIKFTGSGEVVVSVAKEEVTYRQNKSYQQISISVKDTGIGIPAEKIAEIFESFTQADSSTTRRFGGTGLGLTIAKSLTEMMGGELARHKRTGKGAAPSPQAWCWRSLRNRLPLQGMERRYCGVSWWWTIMKPIASFNAEYIRMAGYFLHHLHQRYGCLAHYRQLGKQ